MFNFTLYVCAEYFLIDVPVSVGIGAYTTTYMLLLLATVTALTVFLLHLLYVQDWVPLVLYFLAFHLQL